jgi:hypothetical protein
MLLPASLSELEEQLEAAITCEDYRRAANLRDTIAAALHDSTVAVEHANHTFYKAFAARDLLAMDRVWGEGDHVRCAHPGTPAILGAALLAISVCTSRCLCVTRTTEP